MNRTLSALTLVCMALAAAPPRTAGTKGITVEEKGSGDPVVFLPALGCRGGVWKGVAARIPGRSSVFVSIDGFGGAADSAIDYAAVRDSVARLVREKHSGNVVLVGHSIGGSLALSIAAANPELFSKVVILDAYPFPAELAKPGATPDDARAIAAAVRRMTLGLTDEQFRAQQQQALHMMITGDEDYETVLEWTLASDRRTLADAQFEALSSDLRPSLSHIRCPILVLGSWRGREAMGMSHESVEAAMKQQYGTAPHCRIEISDSARHFLLLDDPEWVARRIASFINQ